MTRLEAALVDLATFLDERMVPYMVIGGFANLYWGFERFTRDIDLAVELGSETLADFVARLQKRFALSGGPDPLEFARRNHLIRMATKTGVEADLMIAMLPYEQAAIRRAISVSVGGRAIRMCSAEDLIIYKLASERALDAVDVEGIVMRQAAKLDREYLRARVRELAAGLERPEIVDTLSNLLRQADAPSDPTGDDAHG
jgi:predicted nucleotidyltransferase